jgi:hypothetical protein
MKAPLRNIRACRSISVVLAIAWLPYIAMRCVDNPATHAGCGMLRGAAHAPGSDGHGPSHEGMAHGGGTHNHGQEPARAHTCCDLTGKCDVKITTGAPSLAPPLLATILPVAVRAIVADPERLSACLTPPVAHAPPTYLRNATLLL